MLNRSRPVLSRALLAVLCLAGFAPPALAHAILIDSTPAANAAAPAGHVEFHLRYNSRIDRERSRLSLQAGAGPAAVLPIAPDSAPNVLDSAAELSPGAYDLHWQVLAVDGHITRGILKFTVTGP